MLLKRWLSGVWIGAMLILFYRLLIGEVLFWGLPSLQFYPWYTLAIDQIRAGQIPYWNPYSGAGAPLMASYQVALLYPPNWLHIIFASPYVMGVLTIGHLWWAGLGMWRLTERLGLTVFGRGVSVLSYGLSAYLIGRVGIFPAAQAMTWLPWLFSAAILVCNTRRWRDVGLLGLIFGLQALTGHAQTTFYSLLALTLYMLWRMSRDWSQDQFSGTLRKTGLLLSGGVLGVALASWQLLLSLEFFRESQRASGLDYEVLSNISFAPTRLITLLMPHFFGTPINGTYLTPGEGIYFEQIAYFGFIPFIAVLFAFEGWFRRRKKPNLYTIWQDVPFWFGLSLLGILLAFGQFMPYYEFLYDNAPSFNLFAQPARWLLLPTFGFSILAGIGIENWLPSPRRKYWVRIANVGAGLIVIMSLALRLTIDDETIRVVAESTIVLGLQILAAGWLSFYKWQGLSGLQLRTWQVGVWSLIAIDLAWASFGMNPSVSRDIYRVEADTSVTQRVYWQSDYAEETRYETYFDLSDYDIAPRKWQELRDTGLPNFNILSQTATFNSFNPLQVGHHQNYLDLIEAQGANADALLRAAAVNTTYGEITPTGWTTARESVISSAPTPAPKAWLVSEVQWVSANQAMETTLLDPTWNPTEKVFLQGAGDSQVFPVGNIMTVELNAEDSQRREYRVQSDVPAILVMAYTHYPGWTATLNSEEVELYRANLAFQAIEIPAGTSEIVVEYDAPYETEGVSLTLIALAIILGLIFSEQLERRLRRK